MAVYGLSVSGMQVNIHFCCGNLDNISLAYPSEKGCTHGSKMKMAGCCQNEQVTLSISDDQLASGTSTVPDVFVQPALLLHHEWLEIVPEPVNCNPNTYSRGSPPLAGNTPLHILHCVYRN
jgi:hypothetical protein